MENKSIIVTVGAPISGGGGGAVDSVNGKVGTVVLDGTEIELIEGGGISVTQAISDLSTDVDTKVQSVTAGSNVEVNNSNPQTPIVSAFPTTTAGLLSRTYFTGDTETLGAGTFYKSNRDGKGTVATATQSVNVNDNQKAYFAQDLISEPYPIDTTIYAGAYSGILNGFVSSNGGEQRFTVEIYKTDIDGNPIASGIVGAPVGDLGVTVIAIAQSGLIDLQQGNESQFAITAQLDSDLSLLTTNRIRYHVSAEKVGTTGGAIDISTSYGNTHVAHLDVPIQSLTSTTINDDPTEFAGLATQYDINRSLKNSLPTISLNLPTKIEAVVGDTIQLFFDSMVLTPNSDKYHFVGKSDIPTEAKSTRRYLEITPTSAGSRLITIYVLGDNNNILDEKTTTLNILPASVSPSTTVYAWNIGDSYISNPTSNNELVRRLTGTGGTPAGNGFTNIDFHTEGNGGKDWNWYVNSEDSPFVYSGVLDFEQYRIDNALQVPTVALLNLTWNGVGSKKTDAEWDLWDDDVYTFIDTIKTQFPNIDVKLVSPSMPNEHFGQSVVNGANGLQPYSDASQLRENLLRMCSIYERIKQEVGYSYVEHIQSSIQTDCFYNTPYVLTDVNTRNSSEQEKVGNDDIHPSTEGYYQIADAQYRNFVFNYCQIVGGAYKIGFNPSNSEYLSTSNISLTGDFTLAVDVTSNVNSNNQVLFNGIFSQIVLFSSGRILYKNETDSQYLSSTNVLPLTGSYNFKVERVGTVTNFYVDNSLVDTINNYDGELIVNAVGNRSSLYFDGEVDNLLINSETFSFSEGAGSLTTGSQGTVFNLNTTGNVSDMWIPE